MVVDVPVDIVFIDWMMLNPLGSTLIKAEPTIFDTIYA